MLFHPPAIFWTKERTAPINLKTIENRLAAPPFGRCRGRHFHGFRNHAARVHACLLAAVFLFCGLLAMKDAASGQTAGATIDSVRVIGVPKEAMNVSRELFSRPGGVLNEGLIDRDRKILTERLRESGWWSAMVAVETDSSTGARILSFRVNPGKPARFGRIRAAAESGMSGLDAGVIAGLEGKPFARSVLDSLAFGVIARLWELGYPDAEISPLLTVRGEAVDISLHVTAGARAHVDSIAVRGLTVTKDRVILRELKHFLGRPVTPGLIDEVRASLDRLGFVRFAADPAIEYSGRVSSLVVRLSEGSRGFFDGAVGYQPSGTGSGGEIVGKADLSALNLFGTGRSARLRWENLGRDTEDMEFRWEEPWAFNLPVDLSGSFAQERRDAHGFTRTLLSAAGGRGIGRLHARAGIRHERISADSLTSSGATGVEAGASWNALNYPSNPRSGQRYAVEWSVLRKSYRFGSGGKTSLTRAELFLDQYIPTFSTQTVAVLLSYRRVDAGKGIPDPADRFWLGGASSLRGYREKIFPADRAFLASLEYRYLTGEVSRVFLFTDIGRLWNSERTGGRNSTNVLTRIGYGFGLRLQSRAGTLGFDYGLGKGDPPGEGKLHVRLTAEF